MPASVEITSVSKGNKSSWQPNPARPAPPQQAPLRAELAKNTLGGRWVIAPPLVPLLRLVLCPMVAALAVVAVQKLFNTLRIMASG
jgi:hypothetical protein